MWCIRHKHHRPNLLRAPTAGVSKLLRPSTNIGDIYLETSAHLFKIQLRRSTHGGFGYRFDDETIGFTNFAQIFIDALSRINHCNRTTKARQHDSMFSRLMSQRRYAFARSYRNRHTN